MIKKISVLCCVILCGTIGLFAQFRPSSQGLKFERTIQLVKNLYIDDVDADKLTEAAIRGMIAELDPHSSYLDKEEVRAMNEPLEGNFDGIGISFNMMTDTLYVMEVISGGPSQKVGLQPGDKIIYVNDTLIAGQKLNNQEVIKKLRGKKGTAVNVKVKRNGAKQLIPFRIIRDKIPIYSIDASYMVNNEVGYIRLSRFGMTSADEFRTAEQKLKALGMKDLILDLTGNGGGILQIANEIIDEFLGNNKLVVYTEGKNQPRMTLNATSKGELEQGKLVVLVDEASASASEILAGAVQDWDRGVVVGRRSFGKGLVQRQFPLPDGSMIRLTVSKYFTPSGRSIQKPFESGKLADYNKDFYNRYQHGEMFNADSIHFPDSLQYKTLVNKRTVYGGGGIMPDYFVPIDTTAGTTLHAHINAKGITNRMALSQVDNNRKQLLKKYPSSDDFIQKFELPAEMDNLIKQAALSDEIEWNEEEYAKSATRIKLQIKALMARDLYDSTALYKLINTDNDIFATGVDIITNPTRYSNLLKGIGSNVGTSKTTNNN